MEWLAMLTKVRRVKEEMVDPDEVALRATLADLRRVSSDIHETNAALSQRVAKMREAKA